MYSEGLPKMLYLVSSHEIISNHITLLSVRGEHLQTLASALKENSDPIYDDLRERLKIYR